MNLLRQPLIREATTALLMALLLLQSVIAVAPGPAWWTSQNALAPNSTPDDFAVANVGQLKHMATQATLAMDAELPGGAGVDIHRLVDPWQDPPEEGVTRDNYLAVNRGQLKNVAAPFYARLGLPVPWAGSSGVLDDYQLINLGQLKHVFSFSLNFRTFGQGPVSIPAATLQMAVDAWNTLTAKPANSTADDLDGDGIPNLQEYLMGQPLFDPDDIDGDRIPDTVEDDHPGILSKLNFADAVWDHDADGSVEYDDTNGEVQFYGDGVMNFEELLLDLNMNAATTSTRTDGLSDAEVLVWTLATGGGLTPVSDPVHAFWETTVNADWLSENYLEYYSNWLVDAEAFREDVVTNEYWSPDPGVWLIQYPGVAYDVDWNLVDLDGDGAVDTDRDSDGLPDLWEYRYQLNLRVNDTQEDPDADGLTNVEEYAAGTNPILADSDGDGFNDGAEVSGGSDPLDGWAGVSLSLALLSNALQYVGTGGSSPPLMVKVTQGGQPVFGVSVEFAVSEGGGLLRANSAAATTDAQVTLTTDSKGIASVTYLAGATPGSAGVTATLTEAEGQSVGYNLSILAGLADTGTSAPVRPWEGKPAAPPPEPDLDGDGIPDKWEIAHGLDPSYSNADWDHDQDGFTDVEEYQMGSDLYDYHSRPLASIDIREKYYRSDYTKTTWDLGEDGNFVATMFFGEADLYGGETYLEVSATDETGHPILDGTDRSQEMRSAFENGSYENLDSDSWWPYVFSADYHYVTSDAYTTGDFGGPEGHKYASGTAMELRLMDPTSPGAPEEDWSRTFLVMEYRGPTDEYGSYSSLPLHNVLGSLKFSRTADGTKSVTFSGDAEGQVKISGNDRVEIIPNEVMGQACRIQLYSIEFAVPDIPVVYADQPSPVLSGDPLADEVPATSSGVAGDAYDVTQSVIEDQNFKTSNSLKVAKFTESFRIGSADPLVIILDTANEPDQFVVRLPRCPLAAGKMSLVLETTDPFSVHNDLPTEIPLQWKGPSIGYVTPRQLLVAHDADDDYPIGVEQNIQNNPPESMLFGRDEIDQSDSDPKKASDRTHLVALGSTIKIKEIRYTPKDPGNQTFVRDPQLKGTINAKYSIKVKAYYLEDSGVTAERVTSDVRMANDIFAQVGVRIKLESGYPKPISLPDGVTDSIIHAHDTAPNNADEKTLQSINGTPSEKGQKLIAACDRMPTEMSIIYCNQILASNDQPEFAGYAYPRYACAKPDFSSTAFVAGYIKKNDGSGNVSTALDGMVMVLAHELGHLMTNEGHFGTNYPRKNDGEKKLIPLNEIRVYNNLMKQGGGSRWPGIGESCRLETYYQEGRIHETAIYIKSNRN